MSSPGFFSVPERIAARRDQIVILDFRLAEEKNEAKRQHLLTVRERAVEEIASLQLIATFPEVAARGRPATPPPPPPPLRSPQPEPSSPAFKPNSSPRRSASHDLVVELEKRVVELEHKLHNLKLEFEQQQKLYELKSKLA